MHRARPTCRRWWLLAVSNLILGAVRPAETSPPAPEQPNTLDTIVIQSDKLSVESRIDRKVYTVTTDAQSTFGTLGDILNNIPSVDVDPSGVVTLRGDTKVLILIDGKPSTQFAGASAGDSLQSIPAGNIERIEVLTTPPAEFKADGVAGVINIITRKHARDHDSATLQASAGNEGRYVIGADGSHGSGPWTTGFDASYRQDVRPRLTQSSTVAPNPPSGQILDSSNSIDELIRRETPTVKLSADYDPNDRQSFGGSLRWDDRGGLRTYTQLTNSSNPQGVVESSAQRSSVGHDPETDIDGRLTFSQKFGESGESLDLALHRSMSHQHELYDYTNYSFIPAAPVAYSNLSFQEDTGITDFSADYTIPLSKTRSLKMGYGFEQDDYGMANIGRNIDPSTGAAAIDPALTDRFGFHQTIHAIYASYQADWRSWTGVGGLRAEEVHTDAQALTNGTSTAGSYFEIYPSLHLDRGLSDHSTLSLGASRRVTRPDPSDLNPYVDYEYTPNLTAGNPNLKPQYSQSYELGYEYSGKGHTESLNGYYRLDHDAVTTVTDYLDDGLSLTTKANLPSDEMGGVEFSADGRIATAISYDLSGNLFYSQIDATALGYPGLRSTTGLNLKAKLDYRPTEPSSLQVTFTRTDKRLTPQGYVGAINLVNLGCKYQLRPDFAVLGTVTDVFDGQRLSRYSSSAAFTEDYRRQVQGRIVFVGFVFTPGSSSKEKKPGFEYAPPE